MAKIKVYRGIGADTEEELEKYIKEFYDKSKKAQGYGGGGNLGDGIYFTTDKNEAIAYSKANDYKDWNYSHVFEVEIDTDDFLSTSQIDYDKLLEMDTEYKRLDQLRQLRPNNDDIYMDWIKAQDKALGKYVVSQNKKGIFSDNIYNVQNKDAIFDIAETVKTEKQGLERLSNYWDKRALQRLKDAEIYSESHIDKVKKIYDQANKDIEKELASIYKNYSKETGLDVQKLKELLTRSESKKTWEQMKRQGLDKYIKDNYKSRISRLEQLQAQVYAKAKRVYPKEELENTMCYKGVINQSYYKTMYDTQLGTGYAFNFVTIDDNMVKALLKDPWSGKNYSQRIWKNTDILADSLSQILGGAMLSGQSIEKTAKQIRDRFDVSKYYAERLIRTETNHFNNEADAMAYEELGVEKYVFVATLDNKTSEICQSMDGEIFILKERQEGVNYPPLHPNCRSKTRGYLGEDVEKNLIRRARNPITGKNEVIKNIKYKDWIKQYQQQPKANKIKENKEKKENKVSVKNDNQVVNGKNIINEWKRRKDEFDFDIEDVVNYQGFDGKPKVVDYTEFKKYMEDSNFYAERTYSANSQEVLNEYQNELYNGKWYIDCSTGGSQYGQGMYCASSYDIKNNKNMGGIGWEMMHYQTLNQEKGNNFAFTEAITLDKSAKIINSNDVSIEYLKMCKDKYNLTDKDLGLIDEYRNSVIEMNKIKNEWFKMMYVDKSNDQAKMRDLLFEANEKEKISNNIRRSIPDKAYNSYSEIMSLDDGVKAVQMGYDVIRAEGHGQSGSYSVILNRSKVIFCKGGSIYGN